MSDFSSMPAPTVVVTGAAGFVGSHVVDYALAHGARVVAMVLPRGDGAHHARDFPNLAHLEAQPGFSLHALDLMPATGSTNPALAALLADYQPDYIFHMAARSHVASAWDDPAATLTTNMLTALALFEAVRTAGLAAKARILNPGSSDQYGYIRPHELPIRETTPLRPGNPYAVSKVAQEMLGFQYAATRGLHIVNTRAFNSIGPRQSHQLATGAFARQIVQAERGLVPPVVRVGNLDARRDYSDVRDIVRGYWVALTSDTVVPGEPYNLCSGVDYRIADVLDLMIEQAQVTLTVETDPARLRPADVPVMRGDGSLFHAATGWHGEIPLAQSIADLLDSWRQLLPAA